MIGPPSTFRLFCSAASFGVLLGAWSCTTEETSPRAVLSSAEAMSPRAESSSAEERLPRSESVSAESVAVIGDVSAPSSSTAAAAVVEPPTAEQSGGTGGVSAAVTSPVRGEGGRPGTQGELGEGGRGGAGGNQSLLVTQLPEGLGGHAGAPAAGTAAVGAAGSEARGAGGGTAGPVGGGSSPPGYFLGADLSVVLQDEHWGATYTENGQQRDVVRMLAQHGFNYARLRTFVDPAAPGGYAEGEPAAFNDLAHTIEMGRRVRAAGMGLLVDFHYSDTWADPLHQAVPQAWAGLDIDQLEAALYDYTRSSLEALVAEGAAPGMVQVGNETTAAMVGVERSAGDSFARLFAAGSRAVRDVDASILVVFHIERCHDLATSRSWLNQMAAAQVDFDVLAQSCYGDAMGQNGETIAGYHGMVGDWDNTFRTLAAEYPDLQFIAAEYSSDKRAINDVLRGLPQGRGLGTFLWGTTRWYDTHPVEPLFTPGSVWSDFVARPEVISLYDQMALEYGLR